MQGGGTKLERKTDVGCLGQRKGEAARRKEKKKLRGKRERRQDERKKKRRWLGDSLAHLAGENHLQVWLLWFSCILSFFMFSITHSW